MCKRFHAYYKPLSPIPQDALFPVYSERIFVFLATVYKRRLFSEKQGITGGQAAPMLHARTASPSSKTTSRTMNTVLLPVLLCFFLRPAVLRLLAELLRAVVLLLPEERRRPFCGSGCCGSGPALCSGGLTRAQPFFLPAYGWIRSAPLRRSVPDNFLHRGNSGQVHSRGKPCPHSRLPSSPPPH